MQDSWDLPSVNLSFSELNPASKFHYYQLREKRVGISLVALI